MSEDGNAKKIILSKCTLQSSYRLITELLEPPFQEHTHKQGSIVLFKIKKYEGTGKLQGLVKRFRTQVIGSNLSLVGRD